MAAAGKIQGRHRTAGAPDQRLLHHRSWGFGRIKTVDTVSLVSQSIFQQAGAHDGPRLHGESLKPISGPSWRTKPPTSSLRPMAATSHLELVRLVLNSYGGRATVDQIQQVLVPDVIRDDWKKWWEAAKRELKKDGHFQVPLKKTEPVVFQSKEISLQERLLAEFRAAKGLKARITIATELLKNAHDLADKKVAATEIVAALNAEVASYQRTQPAVALEAIFIRDDIHEMAGLPAVESDVTARSIWAQDLKLGPLMEQLPAAKHRRAIESFKASNPERWPEVLRTTLNTIPAKLCREFVHLLVQEGKTAELKETLTRLISQHTASSELLRGWQERTDAFADILGPEVFRAMLTAMERDQFNESDRTACANTFSTTRNCCPNSPRPPNWKSPRI
jgi:hypothetical protein